MAGFVNQPEPFADVPAQAVVVRFAETAAEHALVLLALGILAVAAALACVVAAVHAARRYRERIRASWSWVFRQVGADRGDGVGGGVRVGDRSRASAISDRVAPDGRPLA